VNPDVAQLPLRDIHPAAAVGWWPPAPGWWLVALLCVLVIYWLGRRVLVQYRAWRLRQALRAEYAGILGHYQSNLDPQQLLTDTGIFLRRLVVHIAMAREQAGCIGQAWADFLCQPFANDQTMYSICRRLVRDVYRPTTEAVDPDRLQQLAEYWIQYCVRESRAHA